MKPHTLRTIADEMGREKRTVQLWYQRAKNEHGELGELMDGTRYFSDSERDVLIGFAGEKTPQKQVVQAEILPEGFVTSSALAPTQSVDLALPGGFDPAAMVRHFDGVMGQTVNSDQVLAIATIATTAAKKAMDEKLTAQEAALKKAEADKKKLEGMIQETTTDLKIAALKSQLLATQQTGTATELQDLLAQLLAMGKPQDAPAPSSPQS